MTTFMLQLIRIYKCSYIDIYIYMYACMYVIMYTYVSMLQLSMMQSGDSIPDIVTTVSGYIRFILDPLFAAVLHIKVRRRF